MKKTGSTSNPIDPDKVAEHPGLLPYPHHIGSPAFKPTERGALSAGSLRAMEEQCELQLAQIKEQIDLLARQARDIEARMNVSRAVYQAEMNFEPIVGHTYHLYARSEGHFVLSMVAPEQWGKSSPFKLVVASVKLLADRTWQLTKSYA